MSFEITDPGNAALLIGGLCILGSVYYSFGKRRFIKKGQKTIGTIVDSYVPKSAQRLPLTIKVKFTTNKDREETFTEQPLRSKQYPVASEVEVIYDEEQPEIAHINKNEFLWRWEFLFFLGGSGMVFIGIFGK